MSCSAQNVLLRIVWVKLNNHYTPERTQGTGEGEKPVVISGKALHFLMQWNSKE